MGCVHRLLPWRRQDTFSLALLMHELYVGDPAYEVTTLPSHIASLMSGARPTLPPDMPHEYRRLCEQCWATDPDDRPSDDDIIRELEAMLRASGGDTSGVVVVSEIPDVDEAIPGLTLLDNGYTLIKT